MEWWHWVLIALGVVYAAGWFVSTVFLMLICSLFNMHGRLIWSALPTCMGYALIWPIYLAMSLLGKVVELGALSTVSVNPGHPLAKLALRWKDR